MQKQVSRQNLAIVALSILLTLAIALTFTFAAFGANANAKGIITFVANDYTIDANIDQVTDADTGFTGFTYKFTATVDVDGAITYAGDPEVVPTFTFKSNKDGAALFCAMKVVLGTGSAAGFTITNVGAANVADGIITKSVVAGTNTSQSVGLTISIEELVSGLAIDWNEAGEVNNETTIIFEVSVECGSVATDADFIA